MQLKCSGQTSRTTALLTLTSCMMKTLRRATFSLRWDGPWWSHAETQRARKCCGRIVSTTTLLMLTWWSYTNSERARVRCPNCQHHHTPHAHLLQDEDALQGHLQFKVLGRPLVMVVIVTVAGLPLRDKLRPRSEVSNQQGMRAQP